MSERPLRNWYPLAPMDAFEPPYLDLSALRLAFDSERARRKLTWIEVGKQLQIPTVRDMGAGEPHPGRCGGPHPSMAGAPLR